MTWLHDDLLVALVAASALAVALSACLRRRPRQRPDAAPPVPAEEHDRKSTRSKERRRRGKDPLRDLFKGGKKSQALLKAITPDHAPSPADTRSNSSAPPDDTPSSTSRSQSPEPAGDMRAETDDGSARGMTPSHDASDRGSSNDIRTQSVPTTALEANITSASTIMAEEPSSPPACPTPQPRNSQTASTSCAKLVRARTRLRLSRMDPSAKSLLSSTPPPLADSVASRFNSVSCPPLSITWVPLLSLLSYSDPFYQSLC
jgi:hypothetical protein